MRTVRETMALAALAGLLSACAAARSVWRDRLTLLHKPADRVLGERLIDAQYVVAGKLDKVERADLYEPRGGWLMRALLHEPGAPEAYEAKIAVDSVLVGGGQPKRLYIVFLHPRATGSRRWARTPSGSPIAASCGGSRRRASTALLPTSAWRSIRTTTSDRWMSGPCCALSRSSCNYHTCGERRHPPSARPQPPVDAVTVGRNRGGLRNADACSYAYASFTSVPSLHGAPINESPTGNPST